MSDEFKTLKKFDAGNGREGFLHSLPALEAQGVGPISRLPVSIRIVLESVLRNCDGKKVRRKDVETLANWSAKSPANEEIPFVVARIVLQDFTGVPLVVDLAAMRSAVKELGGDPKIIEPLVPVDLVVDHSVQVDFAGSAEALRLNMEMEFKRNRERYEFLKWGQQAFKTFGLVPPGIGIVHQVNLEYLAKGVLFSQPSTLNSQLFYPDTLVGTDSHTTMINGLGVVGWGVGGIEAEAGMLGQPVYFLTPEVVGVHMTGQLREGVTATDLALHITQMLRAQKVVGKFVEFYGAGAASLPLPDRATVGNMAPEYGATMGYFPVDAESVNYLRATGRTEEQCVAFENYFRAQEMFGMPRKGDVDYSVDLELDLAAVQPSVAGPKRPQDRVNLPELGAVFRSLLEKPVKDGGYGKSNGDLGKHHLVNLNGTPPKQGDMVSTDKPDQGIEPGDERNKVEMVANRPTSRLGPGNRSQTWRYVRARTKPHRPRQRADRGDHQLHEHKQSKRDARRRFARQESGRARPDHRSGGENFPRAGLPRRLRLPAENRAANVPRSTRVQRGRVRLHHLHRKFRAAPSKDRTGDQRIRPRGRVGPFR